MNFSCTELENGYGWSVANANLGFNGEEMHQLLNSSPRAVVARKLSRHPAVIDDWELRRKRAYCDCVALRFNFATQYPISNRARVFTNPEFPNMLAVVAHGIECGVANLECRRVEGFSSADAFPEECYTECLQNLAVTRGRLLYLAAFAVKSNQFKIFAMSRDAGFTSPDWCCSCVYVTDEDIARLRETAALYWGYVERGELPPAKPNVRRNRDV